MYQVIGENAATVIARTEQGLPFIRGNLMELVINALYAVIILLIPPE